LVPDLISKTKITGDMTTLLFKRPSVFIELMLFSCQSPPPLATPSAPGISVGVADDLCSNIKLQVGQQVTWTNQGTHEHIVRDITIEGKSQFDSGILKSGDNFAFTFSQPESYTYACSMDGVLTETITVEP